MNDELEDRLRRVMAQRDDDINDNPWSTENPTRQLRLPQPARRRTSWNRLKLPLAAAGAVLIVLAGTIAVMRAQSTSRVATPMPSPTTPAIQASPAASSTTMGPPTSATEESTINPTSTVGDTESAPVTLGQLSVNHRAFALTAAHQVANRVAVGHNEQPDSGWPSGITAVTASTQSGTTTDSNTGYTCKSGSIISVRLFGAFDTVTTGMPFVTGTSRPDNTVREIDLKVDAKTGSTCLISVRTEPAPQSPTETVLFRR